MTREEAIKWLGYSKQGEVGKAVEALDMAIKALEQTTWIPVSERLPEEYKKVIVSDAYNGIYIGEFIDAAENWGGKHFINEHGMHSKSVTAWMPLPKPYKEESEEEK